MTTTDLAAADIELFMFPGACSRVTMTALEAAGLTYRTTMVNIMTMEQKSPAYLAVNPKAKVPALRVDDAIMTENAAILFFIDRQRPSARLLPRSDDAMADTRGLVDMIWCASTLHIMARQMRNPGRLTTGDTAGVHADGRIKFAHECEGISERVADGRWWYGERWSIVDVYLNWVYGVAEKGGFPLDDYPAIRQHDERVRADESFRRAFEREAATLERHKADLPPDHRL